jgi:hypothetical protein
MRAIFAGLRTQLKGAAVTVVIFAALAVPRACLAGDTGDPGIAATAAGFSAVL